MASTFQGSINPHLHGVSNNIEVIPLVHGSSNPQLQVKQGNTARFGISNLTTGTTSSDEALLMMADNNFHLLTQEQGSLFMGAGPIVLELHQPSAPAWMGNPSGGNRTDTRFARFNITTSDNALFIQTTAVSKTARSIKYTKRPSSITTF